MFRRNWNINLVLFAVVTGTVALVEYRRFYILGDRLECVANWLDKGKTLHTAQMKDRQILPLQMKGKTL